MGPVAAPWQRRVEGFVLNKFRGDATLLAPAPAQLEFATGVATIGVLPYLDHALPGEEGPTAIDGRPGGPIVAVVAGPYASNLDELVRLQQVADVRFVRSAAQLQGADLVVLPGSKNVAVDLAWLRATGLDADIVNAAASGVALLGICGGLQQLGLGIDPGGSEGPTNGLGLLDVDTTYRATKCTTITTAAFPQLGAPWQWLSGRTIEATRSGRARRPRGAGHGLSRTTLSSPLSRGERPPTWRSPSSAWPTPSTTTSTGRGSWPAPHLDDGGGHRASRAAGLVDPSRHPAGAPRESKEGGVDSGGLSFVSISGI